ncbi:hypothetical protein GW920_02315 [Candidatus Falkowbacteria bacterium]|uniref:Uncharacterized protein n=1 Tax=Candidatus Falkowbacteria bacterium CG10_big_fil_rev_8_21_14_0_10_37_18 TaxID=1974562 RepID=A0A2H0V8X7_9BACT|nr:hypothetical protein [Candidatus Falkowbacteria bacterium]NCQ12549.1 hypothetical protein [Candidatus Falkowbacteria bacterium]OIO06012.1 MAG: hypothetical protein AUJ26_01845 [Candidatus Falkowbacteria bacterium CG1_02_37_21]PIR95535.1 MAG: hypothetical protein COT93_01875 [Candidatus Falkowbacteria bacterium CG10_big_fil_rev_8_21_14_0_10_37_18]
MFSEQLQKILQLVKKTGDRVVIYDGASVDDSYVVMSFDSYSDLLDKSQKLSPVISHVSSVPVPENIPVSEASVAPTVNLTEEDLTDKINREILMWKNKENTPNSDEDSQPKKAWQIPPIVKNKAQEVE